MNGREAWGGGGGGGGGGREKELSTANVFSISLPVSKANIVYCPSQGLSGDNTFIHFLNYLSVYLFIYLSICLSLYLCIYLSLYSFMHSLIFAFFFACLLLSLQFYDDFLINVIYFRCVG